MAELLAKDASDATKFPRPPFLLVYPQGPAAGDQKDVGLSIPGARAMPLPTPTGTRPVPYIRKRVQDSLESERTGWKTPRRTQELLAR
jgi:hypothetical protein